MPLFEFECTHCTREFEVLIRPGTEAACPFCGSAELGRLPSTFGVASEATRAAALKVGRQLAAKRRRDKLIAERESEDHH